MRGKCMRWGMATFHQLIGLCSAWKGSWLRRQALCVFVGGCTLLSTLHNTTMLLLVIVGLWCIFVDMQHPHIVGSWFAAVKADTLQGNPRPLLVWGVLAVHHLAHKKEGTTGCWSQFTGKWTMVSVWQLSCCQHLLKVHLRQAHMHVPHSVTNGLNPASIFLSGFVHVGPGRAYFMHRLSGGPFMYSINQTVVFVRFVKTGCVPVG